MKMIVVPVDFSDVSGKVAETASSLAQAFGSRVILVHVAEPEPQFVGYDPGPLSVRVAVAADIHAEQERLDRLKEKFGSADLVALHVQGSIPDEILKLARDHDADLIVMGSHGHGALYQLFVGSVTTAVLKEAPCPVLVVPTDRLPGTPISEEEEGKSGGRASPDWHPLQGEAP
jgi:nucleotide-binding universal stress UspA family protein